MILEMTTKIRGAMVGALLGDCLGSAFEGDEFVSKVVLQKYFDKLEGPYFKAPVKMYTDDTAMSKCVAESLLTCGALVEKDMARRFVEEYYQSPRRGYGQNVIGVFQKLSNMKLKDIWLPAREQFDGKGSYGNGGAMRIHPVALFCHHNYELMLDVATKSTQLTHTNSLGVNGALLQCIAVHQCLKEDPNQKLDIKKFTSELIDKMSPLEQDSDVIGMESKTPYQDQLKLMNDLLNRDSSIPNEEIVDSLGHSVAALYSVPTAIYCFLKAHAPIEEIQAENPFRRIIQYSISMGGDTDTIASMAGALAGAYYGHEIINENLQKHCEGVDKILSLSDEFCRILET